MAVLYVLFTSLSLSFSIPFHWPFYRGVPTTAITGPRLPLHEISTGLFIRTACDVTNQFFPFHNTQLRSLSHGRDSVSVQNTKHGSSSLSWIMSSDNDKSLSLVFNIFSLSSNVFNSIWRKYWWGKCIILSLASCNTTTDWMDCQSVVISLIVTYRVVFTYWAP